MIDSLLAELKKTNEGKDRVIDKFLESQQASSILIFSDGAAEDDSLGIGLYIRSCSASC